MTSSTQQLAPALDVDARLTELERSVNLLLNVTPVNAAEAWADFERGDFGTVPTLRLRPLEFEPDLVRRDLYNLEIEDVTDPALHTLFRAKRDEIARQITALGIATLHGSCMGRCSFTEGSPSHLHPPRGSCSRLSQRELPALGV